VVTDHFKIQSDERGITMTKSLAWTMVVGLVSLAFWFGAEMAELKTSVSNIAEERASFRRSIESEYNSLDNRLRTVERSDAQLNQIVQNMTGLLTRIDNRVERIDRRLRQREIDGGGD